MSEVGSGSEVGSRVGSGSEVGSVSVREVQGSNSHLCNLAG